MSYVGNAPAVAYSNTVKDTFSGDGSTVAFTLSVPSTTNNVRVVVENVVQDPTVAYGVSGTTLTFTSAPPSGTDNIYVVHLGPAVQTVQPPTELSGNYTLTGDLTQTGDYTLTGAASVSGNLTVDTDTLFADAANNRVGIGTSSPVSILHLEENDPAITLRDTSGASNAYFQILAAGGSGQVATLDVDPNNVAAGSFFNIKIDGSERMRIDSSGNLLVGTTNTVPGVANTDTGISLRSVDGGFFSRADAASGFFNRNSNGTLVSFRRSGTQVGYINVTTTATAYNTSSDYRLKEDVQPMVGASDRLMALKPVNFAWKVDGSRVDGFLAHEAQEVVPEAVTGSKDAVDKDGNPEYQGIDQSKLVPLLTAALQEALTKIEQLEARMAILEGGAA